MSKRYISDAAFDAFLTHNILPALALISINLKNTDKLNQVGARALGFKNYETFQARPIPELTDHDECHPDYEDYPDESEFEWLTSEAEREADHQAQAHRERNRAIERQQAYDALSPLDRLKQVKARHSLDYTMVHYNEHDSIDFPQYQQAKLRYFHDKNALLTYLKNNQNKAAPVNNDPFDDDPLSLKDVYMQATVNIEFIVNEREVLLNVEAPEFHKLRSSFISAHCQITDVINGQTISDHYLF
jgi:hypothetical protein